MKKILFITLFAVLFEIVISFSAYCSPENNLFTSTEIDTPMAIQGKKNLFTAGRFFWGGQPDEKMLQWLSEQRVKTVTNLRTIEEMEELKNDEQFDEIATLKKL